MSDPRVSVVVTCGGTRTHADEAVRGVFAQTFRDFEVLIPTLDGEGVATEDSVGVPRKVPIRTLDVDGVDVVGLKNVAIGAARGVYVCMLDGDTSLDPTYLARAVEVLDGDAEGGLVSCWLHVLGEREEVWKPAGGDLEALLDECVIAPCAVFRRAAAMAVGGYAGDFGAPGYEDWDLWISLVEHGHRAVIIPEVLAHRSETPTGLPVEGGAVEVHLRAMQRLVERHEGSYGRYLFEVLLKKERKSAELLKLAYHLEWEIETRLAPAVRQRKSEIERLRSKLHRVEGEQHLTRALERLALETGELRGQTARLHEAVQAAEREIFALRHSRSWRITAPLRRAAALLGRLAGGRRGTAG